MITILGLDLTLPDSLRFAATPPAVFITNLVVWILIALAVSHLTRLLVQRVLRRSATQIDDILIGIIRRPLVLLLVANGLLQSWRIAFGSSQVTDSLQRLYSGVLIMVVGYVAWRLLYEVVIAYLTPIVQQTDSQADDIIIPILGRVGPVIIIVALANAVVATLGGNLSALLTGLGLLGLVIGYLFQEPLQGLFSGTYMILDNPFREDDLLLLEDSKICQVRKVGIRVTQLYDVRRHVLVYIPNSKLAATNIVNMTKPSLELRIVLNVNMTRWADPATAIAVMLDACNAHPNILGLWPDKEAAMTARHQSLLAVYKALAQQPERSSADEAEMDRLGRRMQVLKGEMTRLQVEHELRQSGERFSQDLLELQQLAAELEDGGLARQERRQIEERVGKLIAQFDELIGEISAWLYRLKTTQYELTLAGCRGCEECRIQRRFDETSRFSLEEVAVCPALDGPPPAIARRADLEVMHSSETEADKAVIREHFVDRANYMDYLRLYRIWHRNIAHIYRGLLDVRCLDDLQDDQEYRLDERLASIERRFSDAFLLRVGKWQLPSANLVEVAESGYKFQLEFFIDDLVREQFQREERVVTELLVEIDRLRTVHVARKLEPAPRTVGAGA